MIKGFHYIKIYLSNITNIPYLFYLDEIEHTGYDWCKYLCIFTFKVHVHLHTSNQDKIRFVRNLTETFTRNVFMHKIKPLENMIRSGQILHFRCLSSQHHSQKSSLRKQPGIRISNPSERRKMRYLRNYIWNKTIIKSENIYIFRLYLKKRDDIILQRCLIGEIGLHNVIVYHYTQ